MSRLGHGGRGGNAGTGADLRIELRQTGRWWWEWQVRMRNTRPNQWSREPWLWTRSGCALTERGARRAARRAVRQIRFLEAREPIVCYDPPKTRQRAKSG